LHFAKYFEGTAWPSMNVVTRKHLIEAEEQYQDAAKEIRAWYKIANGARWRNFLEVQHVFNVRGNRYRLITIIHYSREKNGRITEGHIYIRSFLTHREYDNQANWDKGVRR